jgi:hypothetical protein
MASSAPTENPNPPPPSEPFRPPAPTSPPRPSGMGTTLPLIAIVIALIAAGIGGYALASKSSSSPSTSSSPVGSVPSAIYFANVFENGTLADGSGVNNSSLIATGEYLVTFYPILDGCTFSASATLYYAFTTSPVALRLVTPTSPGYNVTVYVTNATTGAANDTPFSLEATCPGGFYAAVTSNGSFVSGAGVESTGQFITGDYYVLFTGYVAGCGFVGGLGTSYSGSPGGVATFDPLSGPGNGVFVQTWNSASQLTNSSFYVEVYC